MLGGRGKYQSAFRQDQLAGISENGYGICPALIQIMVPDTFFFTGNLPLRIGEVCSLTVNLSIEERLYVAAGIVRWMRGEEHGVETLVIVDESREGGEQSVMQRVQDKWIGLHARRTARPRKQNVDRDF
jgi:hypothetical protein